MPTRTNRTRCIDINKFKSFHWQAVFEVDNFDCMIENPKDYMDINSQILSSLPKHTGMDSLVADSYGQHPIYVDEILRMRNNNPKVYKAMYPAILYIIYMYDFEERDYMFEDHISWYVDMAKEDKDDATLEEYNDYKETYEKNGSDYNKFLNTIRRQPAITLEKLKKGKEMAKKLNNFDMQSMYIFFIEAYLADIDTVASYTHSEEATPAYMYFRMPWTDGDMFDSFYDSYANSSNWSDIRFTRENYLTHEGMVMEHRAGWDNFISGIVLFKRIYAKYSQKCTLIHTIPTSSS